jgi:hypothetical protein
MILEGAVQAVAKALVEQETWDWTEGEEEEIDWTPDDDAKLLQELFEFLSVLKPEINDEANVSFALGFLSLYVRFHGFDEEQAALVVSKVVSVLNLSGFHLDCFWTRKRSRSCDLGLSIVFSFVVLLGFDIQKNDSGLSSPDRFLQSISMLKVLLSSQYLTLHGYAIQIVSRLLIGINNHLFSEEQIAEYELVNLVIAMLGFVSSCPSDSVRDSVLYCVDKVLLTFDMTALSKSVRYLAITAPDANISASVVLRNIKPRSSLVFQNPGDLVDFTDSILSHSLNSSGQAVADEMPKTLALLSLLAQTRSSSLFRGSEAVRCIELLKRFQSKLLELRNELLADLENDEFGIVNLLLAQTGACLHSCEGVIARLSEV